MKSEQKPQPYQTYIQIFFHLHSRSQRELTKTLDQLSRYQKPHFCTPLCPCTKLKYRQLLLEQKLERQQEVIANLQDGVFPPAIDYLNELLAHYHRRQPSLVDNLLLILAGPRVLAMIRDQETADRLSHTVSRLSAAREASFRRLLSNN